MIQLPSEATPYDHYPEDTWLVIESSRADSLFRSLGDSNSFYRAIPTLELLADALYAYDPVFGALGDPLTVVLAGPMIDPSMHFILDGNPAGLPETDLGTWIPGKRFQVLAPSEQVTPLSKEQRGALEQSRQSLSEGVQAHIVISPKALNILLQLELTGNLATVIQREYEGAEWLAFDASDNAGLYQMTGIAAISREAGEESNGNTALLRYIPSSVDIAMLGRTDEHQYVILQTNYETLDLGSEDHILILMNHAEKPEGEQPLDSYEGSNIHANPLADSAQLAYVPRWAGKAVSATLGEVTVFAANAKQIQRFMFDYLSDDRLLHNAAFRGLSGNISDASFSVIVRPDAIKRASPFFKSEQLLENRVNALVFQSYAELSGQKFFSLNAIHHRNIPDELPILWTLDLDAPIANGPWRFTNHYTNEREVIVQDENHALYLINGDGRVLWKHRLDHPVVGEVRPIDAFHSGKWQMLFATEKNLHLLDRNGNNVEGFPVALENTASATPTAVDYGKKDDYRIFIADGKTLRNIDQEGKSVSGWKNPELSAALELPVTWYYKSGKDYLVAVSTDSSVTAFDRTGKVRLKRMEFPGHELGIYLDEGSSLAECRIVMADSSGNISKLSLTGELSEKNILPLGREAGFAYLHDPERYVSVKNDRLVVLNDSKDVELDYLLPENIQPAMQWVWPEKGWVAMESAKDDHIYVMDLEGRMLDKMPLTGSGKSMVTDLDGNGSRELVVAQGPNSATLVAYKLSD